MTNFAEKPRSNFDVIEPNIDAHIKKLEGKSNDLIALGLLQAIQPNRYTINLAVDRQTGLYYIICNGEALHIRLNLKNLESYLKHVKLLLDSDEELTLSGYYDQRTIMGKHTLIHWQDNGYSKDKREKEISDNNNLVEELFRFAKKIKGEKIDDSSVKNGILTKSGPIGNKDNPQLSNFAKDIKEKTIPTNKQKTKTKQT